MIMMTDLQPRSPSRHNEPVWALGSGQPFNNHSFCPEQIFTIDQEQPLSEWRWSGNYGYNK